MSTRHPVKGATKGYEEGKCDACGKQGAVWEVRDTVICDACLNEAAENDSSDSKED